MLNVTNATGIVLATGILTSNPTQYTFSALFNALQSCLGQLICNSVMMRAE